ncbi:MAG: SGNH/GDSL hydrolase family protein [Xanthobacteraceae bacterium]
MSHLRALVFAATLLVSGDASAMERPACDIPGQLLSVPYELSHVETVVTKDRRLNVAVVGTGSSILAGPDGPRSAYPSRLEAALKRRLPSVSIKVATLVRTRMSAEDMAGGMGKLLVDEAPDLVVWQTGTIDAMRRVDPDNFRAALEEGVERLQQAPVDIILMNMQYSPRTETMVALGPYADVMRVVAQQHEIPLFDRLGIMRQWSDTGAFDLYATGKDNVLAQRVHDCIGRGLAQMLIEAAHLNAVDIKPSE